MCIWECLVFHLTGLLEGSNQYCTYYMVVSNFSSVYFKKLVGQSTQTQNLPHHGWNEVNLKVSKTNWFIISILFISAYVCFTLHPSKARHLLTQKLSTFSVDHHLLWQQNKSFLYAAYRLLKCPNRTLDVTKTYAFLQAAWALPASFCSWIQGVRAPTHTSSNRTWKQQQQQLTTW